MANKYIGVENEFITFREGSDIRFDPEMFDNLKGDHDYDISRTSIRSPTGNAYYVDGGELEICTPPIRINKGFASRLTDQLVMGRNHLIRSTPDYQHTGFSMHWNLSRDHYDGNMNDSDFQRDIAIPFTLFGVTPLSTGFNMRRKGERVELLGDSIKSPDQINATALILGASLLALEEGTSPFSLYTIQGGRNSIFEDGRYSSSAVYMTVDGQNQQKNIKLDQLLKLYYQWLKPTIELLGTKEEVNNLNSFVMGGKQLEMDQFRYFSAINQSDLKQGGVYRPGEIGSTELSQVIQEEPEPELPLEGRLLGSIPRVIGKGSISKFEWGSLEYRKENGKKGRRNSINSIYKLGKSLTDESVFASTPKKVTLGIVSQEDVDSIEEIVYDPIDDISLPEDRGYSLWDYMKVLPGKLNELYCSKGETEFRWANVAIHAVLVGVLFGAGAFIGSMASVKGVENLKDWYVEQQTQQEEATNVDTR